MQLSHKRVTLEIPQALRKEFTNLSEQDLIQWFRSHYPSDDPHHFVIAKRSVTMILPKASYRLLTQNAKALQISIEDFLWLNLYELYPHIPFELSGVKGISRAKLERILTTLEGDTDGTQTN